MVAKGVMGYDLTERKILKNRHDCHFESNFFCKLDHIIFQSVSDVEFYYI